MKICANCQTTGLDALTRPCPRCGLAAREVDGIVDCLAAALEHSASGYADAYASLAEEDLHDSLVDAAYLRRQARNLVRYVDDVRGARACEIGIGQGYLCDALLEAGVGHMTAVDIALPYLRQHIGKPGLALYRADAENLPFQEEFDLLVATDIAEHVLNVGSFLYSVNRALKTGGRFAMRVPYKEGLLGYSPHAGCRYPFGHLRSFDKAIARLYLQQAGFRLRSFHIDGYGPQMTRPWTGRSRLGQFLIRHLQRWVDRRMSHWSDVIDLPRPILALLLRPVELTVVAEKVTSLPSSRLATTAPGAREAS